MIATTCPRCGGALAVRSRFCQTLALRCRVCASPYVQLVPRSAIPGAIHPEV